ncbi:hypothetical protein EL22_16950 [Halostagnicola sp. A56]|nr:hypothetical protein EL22_16950 [Halostagnicola sp. A56]
MCECHACESHELVAATPASELELEQSGRLDPTGTISYQRDLARFLRGRINSLNADLRKRIVEDDVFGLGDSDAEWRGPREAQLMRLDSWFDNAENRLVHDRVDSDEVRSILETAAKSGIIDGHADLREFDIPTDDAADVLEQDAVQEQIDSVHENVRDRVGTAIEDYRSDVRRLVSAGLASNVARRTLAKDITERATVYNSHVTAQASGEVVNQYSTTQLTSYDRVDAEIELETEVEYVDAGDSRVCQRCLELSAQEWTLEKAQAQNPIPVHGYCRCRFRVKDARSLF